MAGTIEADLVRSMVDCEDAAQVPMPALEHELKDPS
jgi:hypothetical protein